MASRVKMGLNRRELDSRHRAVFDECLGRQHSDRKLRRGGFGAFDVSGSDGAFELKRFIEHGVEVYQDFTAEIQGGIGLAAIRT